MNRNHPFAVLKGAGIALAVMLGLLLLANLIALNASDPKQWLAILAHTVHAIGGFLAGWLSARSTDSHAVSIGILSGGTVALALLLGSFFVDGSFSPARVLSVCAALLLLGGIGGYLGKPKAKNGAARRRAMMKRLG